MISINSYQSMKQAKKKISIVTCYDYYSAKIISESNIDGILVGDSLAMVMHGHATTIPATVELMALHTQAVARGANNKLIIADMPFLAHRKDLTTTMNTVETLIRAGAQAIKLERVEGNENLVRHIVDSGVPVMGHLGMTPQSVHQMGGHRLQHKEEGAEEKLLMQAQVLENAGCFAVVLECIPSRVAQYVTERLTIPTIGIGAGREVDGQVLVWHDLLGFDEKFKPKFLKKYLNMSSLIQTALNEYDREVKEQIFPAEEHCY